MTRAVVLGGGLAGVLAAVALTRHADEVVVLESDRYPAGPRPRRGLPQSHHNHVLMTGGIRALDELLPGVVDDLLTAGAHRRNLPGDCLIFSGEGWFHRVRTEADLIACSRPLLDEVIRRHAGIEVNEGVRAVGLTGDAEKVTGVRTGTGALLGADLVVDATGRRSQAPGWLAALGVPPVEEVTVPSGVAYATRLYEGSGDVPAVMVHPKYSPARGGTLFPIEGGRWIVTMTGDPPLDEAGFLAYARELRDPVIADLIEKAEPAGPIRPCHDTANRRRYFENAQLPEGFLAVGDSLVTVNPVFSHGMSVAAMSAVRIAEEGPSQRAAAEVADRSWRMAVAEPRKGGNAKVGRAVLSSAGLAAELFHGQALIPAVRDHQAVFRAMVDDLVEPLTAEQAISQFAWAR
ncbi:NAD(P)/FAD-dependent oxidoreductase [Herbidospora daliensis]|uniref:NAD(P)/FAD-dependent oxidoreductase n=1 Tax=Herbidospora daliensis TaxID=295585 RepID=UPI00078155E4|nr:FAD-dependent monooxygenase [Herbidospora daliensis]